jgi:hypothetical protein
MTVQYFVSLSVTNLVLGIKHILINRQYMYMFKINYIHTEHNPDDMSLKYDSCSTLHSCGSQFRMHVFAGSVNKGENVQANFICMDLWSQA